ncbi:MAG TPA: hypothetical protein PKL77_07195 [Candidatus Omnitrophota bacterium]|nr:hypothetical protein [Candidatus Omnitrophota bacterium]
MEERIAELEAEVAELKKQIEGKDAEITEATKSNESLTAEVAELKKQIEAVKASKGAVSETAHITVVKNGEELEISSSVLSVYKSNGWKVKD